MKRMLALWLLLGTTAATTCAQTLENLKADLQTSLVKKQVILRSFSAEPVVHASWSGGAFTIERPHWHMFGAIQVNSVKVKDRQVVIEGDRNAMFRDKNGKLGLYPVGDPIQIVIDIPKTNMDKALTILKESLFFPTLDDALAAVPKKLQKGIPPQLDAKPEKPLPKCDCADDGTDACIDHAATNGFVSPKLIRAVDPWYSEPARRAHISGGVQVEISLDGSGKIIDMWIAKPIGYGLETQAALAVRQYTFSPATCHSKPVSTTLFIDVNFEIH